GVGRAFGVPTESTLRDVETAGRAMGLQIEVLTASTNGEINAAFAVIARARPDAIFVGASPFLIDRRVQLAQLAARYAVPATYYDRASPEVGGLMSYGANLADAYRQVGGYTGRHPQGGRAGAAPIGEDDKVRLAI